MEANAVIIYLHTQTA